MDRNDQQAIEALFTKLDKVERQSPPRDPEAEAFIRNRLKDQPGAPYYMAQTIVVQEMALETAQARIEQLEAAQEAQQSSGGFLGNLFGNSRPASRSGSVPRIGSAARAAPHQPYAQQGPGFLAGAAQTALGVAGGVLLANAIGGMLGGGEAQAAETGTGADEPQGNDAVESDAGDFGDMEF